METCLARQAWFGGTRYGIADIALFAYSHCAEDGGIALAAYPRLRDWLDRCAPPGFVPLPTPAAENLALIAQSR